MKTVSTMALALALGLGSAVVAPAIAAKKEEAPKAAPLKPSAKIIANDKAAQDAIKKQDWAGLAANADAIAPQMVNDDDKLIVGNYYIQAGQGQKSDAAIGKGIDLILASGKAPADQQPKLYMAQGQIAFSAKDYDKALVALAQARKLGSDSPDIIPVMTEAYSRKGQTLLALQTIDQGIDDMQKAGKPVPGEWFPRAFSIAYAVKANAPDFAAIRAQASDIDRKWLAQEPTGTVWHDVLLLYSESHPNDPELANDTRRLLIAAGGLKGANDYLEYAEAVYQKNPGEAKMVLDEGVKKGAFTFAGNKNAGEINGIVSPKLAGDKASLASSEKNAAASANGKIAVSVADGYYGYGNYAKAVELYKLALTKGGVDANLLNTRIGMALARSGDKEGAKAAFAQVTGPRKELADFWAVHLDHPTTA